MIIAIAIIVVCVLLFIAIQNQKSKKESETIEEIESEDYNTVYDDSDLAYLKVFYKHNEVMKYQVIQVYDDYACFDVEGYNLLGYRKVLNPEKMEWSCPCGCVRFESKTGLGNCISCSVKGDYQRNISIKYANGVTFSFKLQFK